MLLYNILYLTCCNNVVVTPGSISVTADLVLQSTGAVAEHQGAKLGLYRQAAGRHNGKVYYQQLDGVAEGEYLYWNKNNWWVVGTELEGPVGLQNNQDTDLPPSQGINGCVNYTSTSFTSLL